MKFFEMTMWDVSRIVGQAIKVWWVCGFFILINVLTIWQVIKEMKDKS